MKQEINLYQPVKRRRDWLGVNMLPAWVGVLAVALAVVTALYWRSVDLREQRSVELAQQVEHEREAVAELRAAAPADEPDPELRARVESLEAEIAARRRLEERVVAPKDAPWRQGFASLFDGLAREPIDDLWLKRIEADAGGDLRLEGSALRPEVIPAFVNHLGREPEFIGKSFAGLEVRRPEQNGQPLGFVLRGNGLDDD